MRALKSIQDLHQINTIDNIKKDLNASRSVSECSITFYVYHVVRNWKGINALKSVLYVHEL